MNQNGTTVFQQDESPKFYRNIDSPNVKYSPDGNFLFSDYSSKSNEIEKIGEKGGIRLKSRVDRFLLQTDLRVPKVGLLLVGLGGNNGTTLMCGILANKLHLQWQTRLGTQTANYFGSVTQCGTMKVGSHDHRDIFLPVKALLPLVDPNDFVLGGWDISGLNMAEATRRAQVLEPDLIGQLNPHLEKMTPWPAVFYPEFVAANQSGRADNLVEGEKKLEHLEAIRKNIRDFKIENALDTVVVVWTATTERFTDIIKGVNDTAENIQKSVKASHPAIAPSTIYALASILEGSPFVNGSPQNTFVPGVVELAEKHGALIAGDDFKSGQTKVKTAVVEFLVGAGIKPLAVTSYNHLGNNDGANLSAPDQFRSKEISKSSVIDDSLACNPILFPNPKNQQPDHTVVIKYVPSVGDSKRAMDEYYSEIFMGGRNTMAVHNVCEDSLLAAPLIVDLAVLMEFLTRLKIKKLAKCQEETAVQKLANGHHEVEKVQGANLGEFHKFSNISTILGYFLKAPLPLNGASAINCLGRQRRIVENLACACLGLTVQDLDVVFDCIS